MIYNVFVVFLLSAVYVQPSYSTNVNSKYLQFSNQSQPLSKIAISFATLESQDLGKLPSSTFTICGSIYIGFYRGVPTFYTVRRNDQKTLWFSLSIDNQDTAEEVYLPVFTYFGGIVMSNTGGKLVLRPHAWSHACTTVDMESGHVTVVINGILTHNMTISSKDFTANVPTVFQNNLVLGVQQFKFQGSPSVLKQSEASVTDVHVFSAPMNLSQMVESTSNDQWPDGDIVSWTQATWNFSGNTEEITNEEMKLSSSFSNLFKMADGFNSAHDCMNLCPRIQAGGRLPLTRYLFFFLIFFKII